MKGLKLVVAALLLTSFFGEAAKAADKTEHQSNNAHKLLVVLDSMGINNQDIQHFVGRVNAHVDHGYLTLAERQMKDGSRLTFHYQLNGKIGTKQFELKYVPEKDSHFVYTASPHQAMVSYHLSFDALK